MTFFNYKNYNTFKDLTGISSDGLIMFMAFLRIHGDEQWKE